MISSIELMKTLWEKGGGEATVALVHLTRPTCAKIGRKFDYHGFWGFFCFCFFFVWTVQLQTVVVS